MGYRELLKKYMQHVTTHSGQSWLSFEGPCCDLTAKDIAELRLIHNGMTRAQSGMGEPSYNSQAEAICERFALGPIAIADMLGWPIDVIERWFAEPTDERYKTMSKRDFRHFQRCLGLWLEQNGHPPEQPQLDLVRR